MFHKTLFSFHKHYNDFRNGGMNVENTKDLIRIYSIEEYNKYLNKKKYVSLEELVEINKIQITPKLHQR